MGKTLSKCSLPMGESFYWLHFNMSVETLWYKYSSRSSAEHTRLGEIWMFMSSSPLLSAAASLVTPCHSPKTYSLLYLHFTRSKHCHRDHMFRMLKWLHNKEAVKHNIIKKPTKQKCTETSYSTFSVLTSHNTPHFLKYIANSNVKNLQSRVLLSYKTLRDLQLWVTACLHATCSYHIFKAN